MTNLCYWWGSWQQHDSKAPVATSYSGNYLTMAEAAASLIAQFCSYLLIIQTSPIGDSVKISFWVQLAIVDSNICT